MTEFDRLISRTCKPFYPYDCPREGFWRLAIVPIDPLFWYGVNTHTNELRKIGPVTTIDYMKAIESVRSLNGG